MTRISAVLLAASITLLVARPAAAGLILSFDQTTYTIAGVGDAIEVQVMLSQDSGGAQVGPGNELLTAGVTLSFATTGAAIVQSSSDVSPGSAWDMGDVDVTTDGSNTLVSLGLTSLLGVADLSSPLLLGAFKFTAQAVGATTTSVISLGPGPSFITLGGDILDPSDSASARIGVSSSPPVVPEPSALLQGASAAAVIAALAARRRRAGA